MPFTGDARPEELSIDRVYIVEFRDGARTYWHTHTGEQTLCVLRGLGWLQYEGEEQQELNPGDVVTIRRDAKHWHGARSGETMAHVALTNGETNWLDEVDASV